MKYFMMSMQFNKTAPEEFGLKYQGDNTYVFVDDNSIWKARELYNFGWGNEVGFYREPILGFDELFTLGATAKDKDNLYGAAIILIEDYPEELLIKIEEILNTNNIKKYNQLFEALELKNPINRSMKEGQDFQSINSSYKRWKNIADKLKCF